MAYGVWQREFCLFLVKVMRCDIRKIVFLGARVMYMVRIYIVLFIYIYILFFDSGLRIRYILTRKGSVVSN